MLAPITTAREAPVDQGKPGRGAFSATMDTGHGRAADAAPRIGYAG
jgi:hypothetical protein